MFTAYLVIAAFLYWPFRKWVATAEAPGLSALLWPLMVIFFIGAAFFALFSKDKAK